MNYYRITLSGRGSEVYPFELTDEQYENLMDGHVENDGLNYDDVCQILNVESYFDCIEKTIMGPHPQSFHMRVDGPDGKIIYEIENFDYENCVHQKKFFGNKKYLFIEDYCKGEHILYNIPLDDEFDPSRVKFKLIDIGGKIEIVNGVNYDGEDLELYKTYGDTQSKGYYYHLKTNY